MALILSCHKSSQGSMSGDLGQCLSRNILANAITIGSLGWGMDALKKGLNFYEDSSEGDS